MSKGIINNLILATTALSLASCSGIFSKNTPSQEPQIITETIEMEPPTLASKPTEVVVEESAPTPEIVESQPIEEVEEPTIDSAQLVPARPKFAPFTAEQSSKMAIAEYQNIYIEDLIVDLGAEDAHYPSDGLYITSPYGWRKGKMHAGIDIKVLKGDNIYSAFDGVVRLAKYYSSYGYCVIVRHYNGLETLYAHCSKLLVEVDQEVNAGELIALGGSTGRSTGSHLHFEVRIKGQYIDPNYILDTKNTTIKDCNLYITQRNGRIFASNNDSKEEREAYILSQISIRYHTVKSGDTLSRIAVNNGTTVTNICRLNGISSKSVLRIGQRLIVRDGVKVATTKTTTASTTATATTKSSTTSATTNSGDTHSYTIRSGDTLSTIAQRNGTTISEICALNNISANTTIKSGSKLLLPGKGSTTTTTAPTTQSTGSSSSSSYHTVKSGDTLSAIAKRYGTTVSVLCSINGISENSTLQLGQKIKLTGSNSATTAPATTSATYHTVKSGDTLSRIAQRNNTTIDKLCSLNNISRTSVLQIGQKLRVR